MLCTRIVLCFTLTRVPLADLNGVLGNYATLGLNIADFSRYANKPSAQNVQAIVIPVIFSEFPPAHSHVHLANQDGQPLLACLVSSLPQPAQTAYGQIIWNPIVIINLWMEIRVPRWPRCCRLWRHRLDHRYSRYQHLGQLHQRSQRSHVILPQVHQHPPWSTACCRHW
jgi:hypothetical protein